MCGILSLEWSHAQPTGRKTMDKSCQVYGNFHNGNHGMKCGTPGLYRSPKSIFKAGEWYYRQANVRYWLTDRSTERGI